MRSMMKLTAMLVAACATLISARASEPAMTGRWSAETAWAWYEKQPWLVGCNFLPSTAVNDVEMWQAESFDLATIDRELGWAQDLGFNSVRVFLNYVVWQADPDGFKKRFEQFLKMADQHGISTMPIFFDDCAFAGKEPQVGPQADPVPGVHNSGWVPSPGKARVTDPACWPELKKYVQDMVGSHKEDRRIVLWDLYNEPCNDGMGAKSMPLVEAAFAWAREIKPVQPLTVGAWANFSDPNQRRMMELSDVVSFHGYDSLGGLEAKLKICREYGRPMLCTEWMARGGCRFETHLPFFKENKIGCWNWGLVAGRTQTYYPWGSPKGAPEPKLWHHDILRKDGTPFNAREVQLIKVTTDMIPPPPPQKVLVPTAEQAPVPWRYTLVKPGDDWFKTGFDDTAWQPGSAPFGTQEASIARKPNTVWSSADIWLRREFELSAGLTGVAALLHYDEDAEVYIDVGLIQVAQ